MGKNHFWSICTDSIGYQTFCSIWFRIFLVALLLGFITWRYSTFSEEDKQRRHERWKQRRYDRRIWTVVIFAVIIIYVGYQKLFK